MQSSQQDSNNVEYILTASFQLSQGSTLVHQYPVSKTAANLDSQRVAELMLPSHTIEAPEDWTVFFLYREFNNSQLKGKLEYKHQTSVSAQRRSKVMRLYALSLVTSRASNTRPDVNGNTKKIRSLCVVSKWPFFHIWKPLVILALDQYNQAEDAHEGSGAPIIRHLYNSINSVELGKVPKLNYYEKLVLTSSEKLSLLEEKFSGDDIDGYYGDDDYDGFYDRASERRDSSQTLTNSSFNATPVSSRKDSIGTIDTLARKGSVATVDSHDSSISRNYYIDLKTQGQASSTASFKVRDTHYYDTEAVFNNLRIPLKVPLGIDSLSESVGEFSVSKLVESLLKLTSPCEILHPELTIYGAYTPALLVLINGLLTQKRILFLGTKATTSEIGDRVLAACSLGSGGVLKSFVSHAFPYADPNKIDDLISSEGYIAGTRDPSFLTQPSWWDILVNLDSNTLTISNSIGVPSASFGDKNAAAAQQSLLSTMNPEDVAFLADLKIMLSDRFSEASVRSRCSIYIRRFIRIASNYEENRYGRTNMWPSSSDSNYEMVSGFGYTWVNSDQKTLDFNTYSPVLEGWRTSRSYRHYIDDQRKLWPKLPKKVVDYDHQMDKLRYHKLSSEESQEIYTLLAENVQDPSDVLRLLVTPTLNNLFFLGLGLFHSLSEVRLATAKVIQAIELHYVGRHFFSSMSQFQKVAYKRLIQEYQSSGMFSSRKPSRAGFDGVETILETPEHHGGMEGTKV